MKPVLLALTFFGVQASMDCGSGVKLCGLLTLETGYGSGNYEHPEPVVHGLWPEVSPYGTSSCIAPGDASDPQEVYSCYDQRGETQSQCLSFEQHEWGAHGICAGATDAEDFFTQVCSLAVEPIAIMNATRQESGDNLDAYVTALEAAGYSVYATDSTNSQVEITACAGPDTRWVLAPVADFPTVCGGWGDDDDIALVTDDSVTQCVPNTHGPACTSDADCIDVSGCIRCAGSGYCTDVPL